MDTCAASTKSGRPCGNPAVRNGLCSIHDDGTFRGRCTAVTAKGKRCRNKAVLGDKCPAHDGMLAWRQELNRQMRRDRRKPVAGNPDFVPANQRDAEYDDQGRLRAPQDRGSGLPVRSVARRARSAS